MHFAILSIHSSPLGRQGTKDTGGMSTYLLGLSTALANAGHRVDIFTAASGAADKAVQEIAPSLRLINLNINQEAADKNEIFAQKRLLADEIGGFYEKEKESCNLLFSHYWISASVGDVLADRMNLPHLVMFHTLGRAKHEEGGIETESRERLEEEERLVRRADLIIVAAQSERERMIKYFSLDHSGITVIPSGIDRRIFNRAKAEGSVPVPGLEKDKLILYVGRIELIKRLDLLIEAAAMLPPGSSWRVVIIGGDRSSTDLVQRLKKKAFALGIGEKVLFTGSMEHEKLNHYYRTAAVTVLPSAYESFGLTVLESIACGTAVVAGPVGIIPELAAAESESNLVYQVGDHNPASWAAALDAALKNSKKIPDSVIDRILKPFNWEAAVERLVAEVQTLLSEIE